MFKKQKKENEEKTRDKLFPWLMEDDGELTLDETADIENLLEDKD